MESLSGHLLIAEPRLPDTHFYRTVVLVLEHNPDGASGLILNRPGRVRLGEILGNGSDSQQVRDDVVYFGGPVEGPLAVLHSDRNLSEKEIVSGVCLSMKKVNLDRLLVSREENMRAFSGYSGWGPGQLDHELQVGGWLTWPALPAHVFGDSGNLYKTVCDDLGREILFGSSIPGIEPSDPTLN